MSYDLSSLVYIFMFFSAEMSFFGFNMELLQFLIIKIKISFIYTRFNEIISANYKIWQLISEY